MNNLIKTILLLILITTLATLTIASIWFWHDYWRYPSTKQAVLKADFLPLQASANGTLVVYVKNRSLVNRGQLLCGIDPDPKRKQEKTADAALTAVMKKINQNRSKVTAAQKLAEERQRQLSDISKHIYDLQENGKIEDAALAKVDLENTKKALTSAQEDLTKAYQQLGNPLENTRQINEAKLQLNEAQIRTKITYVYAPADGLVDFTVPNGIQVVPKKFLGNIVKDNAWWVEAEFKPISTHNIKPYQLATITLANNSPAELQGEVKQVSSTAGGKIVIIRLLAVNQPFHDESISHVLIDTGKMALPAPYARSQ